MFILFFGTRPGKTITRQLHGVSCSFCGQKNTLTARISPNYFHLFWLPLFRVSDFRLAECSHCKRSFFRDEFTPEMEAAMND